MSEPIWRPNARRIAQTNLVAFMKMIESSCGAAAWDFPSLYEWSIRHPETFWQAVWQFCHVTATRTSDEVVRDSDTMPGAKWFPTARLNFAEKMLLYRDEGEALGFWNDLDGRKFRETYFDNHAGVWRHGDYAELTEHDGMIIHGRSDAILNPGGVRIGTAEIYRQVEQLPEVLESLVVGQDWHGEERVVLFVTLRPELVLDDELVVRIRDTIRRNTTPRHVPAKVIQVDDIPRTKSGKIVELAVRDVIHNRPVRTTIALANPGLLKFFEGLPELS